MDKTLKKMINCLHLQILSMQNYICFHPETLGLSAEEFVDLKNHLINMERELSDFYEK